MTNEEISNLISANAHVSTSEIKKDIIDTENEISLMSQEEAAFLAVPFGSRDYRFSQMKASHRRKGIEEREVFIKKLRTILEYREPEVELD